jgi:hypothetical protein
MAIWQFDLTFFPRGGPAPGRHAGGCEVPRFPDNLAGPVHLWLALRQSPSRRLAQGGLAFGKGGGDRIDFRHGAQGGLQLSCRIDARARDGAFCESVCSLAAACDGLLFSPELGCSLEPSPPFLGRVFFKGLMKSGWPAMRFP